MKNWKRALLAALVIQVWSMASWMLIPWHMVTLSQPTDGAALMAQIKKSAPTDGVYLLPVPEEKHSWESHAKAMSKGPVGFMILKPNGTDPGMGKQMALGFLMNFLAALGVLWILGQAKPKTTQQRIVMGTLVPMIGMTLVNFAYFNWWYAPLGYTLVGFVDGLVGWVLASLVMKPAKGA